MEDKIALWPDGTYCELDEIEEYMQNGMSDDYKIIERSKAGIDDE